MTDVPNKGEDLRFCQYCGFIASQSQYDEHLAYVESDEYLSRLSGGMDTPPTLTLDEAWQRGIDALSNGNMADDEGWSVGANDYGERIVVVFNRREGVGLLWSGDDLIDGAKAFRPDVENSLLGLHLIYNKYELIIIWAAVAQHGWSLNYDSQLESSYLPELQTPSGFTRFHPGVEWANCKRCGHRIAHNVGRRTWIHTEEPSGRPLPHSKMGCRSASFDRDGDYDNKLQRGWQAEPEPNTISYRPRPGDALQPADALPPSEEGGPDEEG